MKRKFLKIFLIGLMVSAYLFPFGCVVSTDSSQPTGGEILPDSPTAIALTEYTTADNADFFEFAKAEGAVEKYVLLSDGEEVREVQPNAPIDKAEFGEKPLKIRAYYQDGGIEESKEISYANLQEISVQDFESGNGVTPQFVTENIPSGGGKTALKLEVLPTLDSVYTANLKIKAIAN